MQIITYYSLIQLNYQATKNVMKVTVNVAILDLVNYTTPYI